ncbi:MAG TPA: hypothetical protein PK504_03490 [Ferruginibacter sp.]|nr:hypothetical protein [Ferruginibacter sp.]HRE65164.1 hypothetical protein [Ferruginibacter sp.]
MNLNSVLYTLTHWKAWHHHVKYIPISPVWVWYIIRSGTPWFFTPSNPTLTFGGFEGEGKKEMYEQLPQGSYPKTIYIEPNANFSEVEKQIFEAGFEYPFIVKPDVGMMGFMFRKISNADQLRQYHQTIPIEYLVQELIDYPIEVSVFYFRMPNAQKGTVSGFLKKEPPYVLGDGIHTVEHLLNNSEALKQKREMLMERQGHDKEYIPKAGEKFYLSYASNRSQGGLLEAIDHEIDDNLQALMDELSQHSGMFYYGRYDIKCASIEDFKKGKNFSILEFNGAGAGVQHIYANDYSLWKACSVILTHWKMLYKISRYNHKNNGIPYWGFLKGWKHLKAAKKNLMMLLRMDANFPGF